MTAARIQATFERLPQEIRDQVYREVICTSEYTPTISPKALSHNGVTPELSRIFIALHQLQRTSRKISSDFDGVALLHAPGICVHVTDMYFGPVGKFLDRNQKILDLGNFDILGSHGEDCPPLQRAKRVGKSRKGPRRLTVRIDCKNLSEDMENRKSTKVLTKNLVHWANYCHQRRLKNVSYVFERLVSPAATEAMLSIIREFHSDHGQWCPHHPLFDLWCELTVRRQE